ncbi:MAG: rRNA pseudouridine synthase [Bacteroidales bacterium]|nr:rRNA pseudouridine synthase [Bacteroidales bacterium]
MSKTGPNKKGGYSASRAGSRSSDKTGGRTRTTGPGKGKTDGAGRGRSASAGKGRLEGGSRTWSSESRKGKPEGKSYSRSADDRKGKPEGKSYSRSADDRKRKPEEKSRTRPAGAGKKKPDDDLVRLNKYVAASGVCSRREADQLITAGLISVNGKTINKLGTKVKPDDDVRYNGQRIRNERKVYLLLNKPKDYVTTTDDPKERKTVMLLIRNACNERIYPVGRLDRNTTGVMLFTNDGEMAKKLTHPSYNKKKIYHIFLDKGVTAGDLKKLADGITLDDGLIQPDAISYASSENKREIGMEIHSGRNRIVRRMFESLGYRVNKLDRVYFAGLTKKSLSRGKWRFLTEKEIGRLKMNAYE